MARSASSLYMTGLKHRLLGTSIVITALVLASCTTSDPDGHVYSLVACGGGSTGVSNICYARAEQLCPGGYTVLSEDQHSEPQEMHIACRRQSAEP